MSAPRISRRLTELNADGSAGWELYYRARELRAAGVEVIDLTIGDHDLITPAPILDAMDASARGGNTGYAPVPGQQALRAAIAARVTAETGVATTADNVLVTAGGQAALFAAHMAALDPGETALMIDPYYATYPGTIRAASARPVAVPSLPGPGFQPDAAAVERAASQGARSLLINSPNNPTGAVYTAGSLAALADIVQRHDMWLISDEVYATQVWQGRHLSPRALPGMADRTLVVGSFSKSHRMTGARIGWLIGPPAAVAAVGELMVNTTYGVAGFIQDAALAALEAGPALEAETAEVYRRRRQIALQDLGPIGLAPGGGGMYALLDVSATGMDGAAFALALLDRSRIAVMPGNSFGTVAADHVRIALTVRDDRLQRALATLRDFFEGQAAGHMLSAQAPSTAGPPRRRSR